MAIVYTFAQLQTPLTQAENKLNIYQDLIAAGLTQVQSWESGSVPSALVEVEAQAVTELQGAAQQTLYSGLNELAEGDALTVHAAQVYDNDRFAGRRARGRVLLQDAANAGPFSFDPASTSFSVGEGGLLFIGYGGQVTLTSGGQAYVPVEAEAEGSAYNVAAGTITFFSRGILPGVTVTNEPDWQTAPSDAQLGTNPESDPALRTRDRGKWGTLGTGSPPSAYENWALTAGEGQVTKTGVFTNLDLLDPGRVDVILAGDAGAVPASVVLAVQVYISENQVGGERIPETARAVVSSAANYVLAVSGTLFVQGAYNTAAFQAGVTGDLQDFVQAIPIGGRVSWERLLQVALNRAGLSPGIITDVSGFAPSADVQLAYNEVAVLDVTGLLFTSV